MLEDQIEYEKNEPYKQTHMRTDWQVRGLRIY